VTPCPIACRPNSRKASGVIVETAKDALAKIAELTDLGHTEIVVKDLLGEVVDRATLEA
jgi:hypothetical protein